MYHNKCDSITSLFGPRAWQESYILIGIAECDDPHVLNANLMFTFISYSNNVCVRVY